MYCANVAVITGDADTSTPRRIKVSGFFTRVPLSRTPPMDTWIRRERDLCTQAHRTLRMRQTTSHLSVSLPPPVSLRLSPSHEHYLLHPSSTPRHEASPRPHHDSATASSAIDRASIAQSEVCANPRAAPRRRDAAKEGAKTAKAATNNSATARQRSPRHGTQTTEKEQPNTSIPKLCVLENCMVQSTGTGYLVYRNSCMVLGVLGVLGFLALGFWGFWVFGFWSFWSLVGGFFWQSFGGVRTFSSSFFRRLIGSRRSLGVLWRLSDEEGSVLCFVLRASCCVDQRTT